MADVFTVTEDAYADQQGRQVRVAVLRNSENGQLAEILLNTPGGQNRSTGSGAVNGLLLRDPQTNKLREVQPHRRGFAGGVMAPFANRVRNGLFNFGGEQHQLACNWDEVETRITGNGQHAIHGLLPQELNVSNRDATSRDARLTLTASFDGSYEGYPFLVNVAFTYSLGFDGFAIEVAATNVSETGLPAPFMVGWHPYFQLEGAVSNCCTRVR